MVDAKHVNSGVNGAATGCGGRLVTADGRTLPLRGVRIRAEAGGGLARVALEQRFVNSYPEPLRVSYLVPLPTEGTLAGYAIRIGERRILGEVDRVTLARERFERALVEGRSAGLVEQERSNLFTLEIGNIPAGAEVVAELQIDQRLAWRPEGEWEWRFPLVVAPRYQGAEGRVPDADRVTVDVAEPGLPARAEATVLLVDPLGDGRRPESPSHGLRATPDSSGLAVSFLGDEGTVGGGVAPEAAVPLDRELVLRWAVARPDAALTLCTGRPAGGRPHADAAYGLLTITPPAPETRPAALARDVIVLLDTSGSMAGTPLEQARRVVTALVESLNDQDQLELIEFSDRPRRWRAQAVPATAAGRQEALRWLAAIRASGGTEMLEGIKEALHPLRDGAQRQVVLVTDGLVGFETEIVRAVARALPATSRLHAIALGSAPNRALTGPVARAGRGTEVVIDLVEEAEAVIGRLLAQMQAPVLTDVRVDGPALLGCAPARLPDVYVGAPLRVAVKLRPEGGDLRVRGLTPAGGWEERVILPAVAHGEGSPAVVTLYAREAVGDLEMREAAGFLSDANAEIERIGLAFQIATRRTAWVAVSEEPAVDPTAPLRRERIPHELPYGRSAEGLGLRRPEAWVALTLSSGYTKSAFTGAEVRVPPRLFAEPFVRSPRVLRARLTVRRDRELVIEIEVTEPLRWYASDVKVIWKDGPELSAAIVGEGTTRSGDIAAGQVVRLVLLLNGDGPSQAPVRVEMKSRGEALHLSLRR